MQINPKTVKTQFEKSLKTYNENAIVQKIMAEKLTEKLIGYCNYFENILELGCGSGLLTQEIHNKISFKTFFGNDLSEKSKSYIQNIIPNAKFYTGNAKKIKPTQRMDLIISNAMFQWFKDINSVFDKNILNKGGFLAFSTFSPTNFKEIKELTGLSLKYKSIDEIKSALSNDYEILYTEEFEHVLEFSNPLQLLAHMKNTGVNSISEKQMTFMDIKEFCEKYKEKYPKITLTYSPIIVICQKR